MKIASTLRVVLIALSLAVVAAGVAAATREAEMLQMSRQEIPAADVSALTIATVRSAIIEGGRRHGWRTIGDKPGVLILVAQSGEHRALVDVAYDEKSYQILYRSSEKMNYAQVGAKVTIHPKYNRWIEGLDVSIRTAISEAQTIHQ